MQVRQLLRGAKDPDAIIAAEPACMTPKTLASILVTINKWYHLEKDPVQVLENDPDLVRRAQVGIRSCVATTKLLFIKSTCLKQMAVAGSQRSQSISKVLNVHAMAGAMPQMRWM